MPRKLEIITRISEDVTLPKEHSRIIREHLHLYAGRKARIEIGPADRTLSQNARYHGFVLTPIRDKMHEVGLGPISHDALHCYFRDLILSPTIEIVFGEEKVVPPSTRNLNSTEFFYYCEAIKNLEMVRQLGVEFPELEEAIDE